MTREEAIDIIKCLAWHTRPDEEDVEQAIKALEQQPCDDCVSRQEVLSYICNDLEFGDEENGCNLERKIAQEEIYNFIKKMKPTTPTQQTCENAVSRQDALNCVTSNEFRYRIVEDIKALPSVTPKSKSESEHDHEAVKAYNDGQAYILDKLREEIENDWQFKQFPRSPWSCGLRRTIEIIDKYRGGSE